MAAEQAGPVTIMAHDHGRSLSSDASSPAADECPFRLVDLPCGCQDVHYACGYIDREHDHVACDARPVSYRARFLAWYQNRHQALHSKPARLWPLLLAFLAWDAAVGAAIVLLDRAVVVPLLVFLAGVGVGVVAAVFYVNRGELPRVFYTRTARVPHKPPRPAGQLSEKSNPLRRLRYFLAAAVLAAGFGLAAAPAHATTPTCTAGQVPVGADPISCGGLFFPQLGHFGLPPSGSPLTLTLANPQWNGHYIDEPYSAGNTAQDETVYERCTGFNPSGRTEADPCGTGFTPVLEPNTGLPEFVAESTPDGKHLGGALNTPGNLCISVEGVFNGPRHALRERLVARTCDTFGAVFDAGLPDGFLGITGVVTSPNPWQTWSAVGPVNGVGNFVFANDELSGHFLNRLFVVDVPGAATTPGQWLLAYPENDHGNQTGELAGCNGAAEVITPGNTDCP